MRDLKSKAKKVNGNITLSWMDLIRKSLDKGKTSEQILNEVILYGKREERRITLAFNYSKAKKEVENARSLSQYTTQS